MIASLHTDSLDSKETYGQKNLKYIVLASVSNEVDKKMFREKNELKYLRCSEISHCITICIEDK